jgi:hypothetical protein
MHYIKCLAHVYTYRCFWYEYACSLRNTKSGINCRLPVYKEIFDFEIVEIMLYHERLQTDEGYLCREHAVVLLN